MPESVQALLASLTGQTGTSPEQVYAKWAGISAAVEPFALETLVRYHVYHDGVGTGTPASPQFPAKVTASQKESLLGILKAGGAVGESVEQTLRDTGLTGWS